MYARKVLNIFWSNTILWAAVVTDENVLQKCSSSVFAKDIFWSIIDYTLKNNFIRFKTLGNSCFKNRILTFLSIFMYIGVLPVSMSVSHIHMYLVPAEFRTGHHIPWNWSWRCLWTSCRCYKSNPGLMKEQPLLTSDPSFQLPSWFSFAGGWIFLWQGLIL